jgi:uncharacterized protein YjbJ (UPF0337 family)
MGEILDKAKGKIKQAVGDLTGDKELKHEGERDELKGKMEGAVTDVEDVLKDAKHKLEKAVK